MRVQRRVCRGLGQERTPSWEELRSWRWLQADLCVTRHLGEQGASVQGGLCCFSQAALVIAQQPRQHPGPLRTWPTCPEQDAPVSPLEAGVKVTVRVRSQGPWVPRHLGKHCALRIAGSVFLDDTDIQMVDFRHSQASAQMHTQAHPRPPRCTAGSVCLGALASTVGLSGPGSSHPLLCLFNGRLYLLLQGSCQAPLIPSAFRP